MKTVYVGLFEIYAKQVQEHNLKELKTLFRFLLCKYWGF